MFRYLVVFSLIFSPFLVLAETVIKITPINVIQGEPALISVLGLTNGLSVKRMYFGKTSVSVFDYEGKPTGIIGVDMNAKTGVVRMSATLSNGKVVTATTTILAREKLVAPLGIPAKLGGNTKTGEKALVSTLALESALISGLKTGTKVFWSEPFVPPLKNPIVTDIYGYTRKTGGSQIVHKGTDYRAKDGTPVYAMNRGVVRLSRELRNYGKTIVIDHGLGVQTLYLHLSQISVATGALVLKGQEIGRSGQTGYAEVAHLHLSVKINGVSIDPEKFLALFK